MSHFVTCVTVTCDITPHLCLSPKFKKSKIKTKNKIRKNKKKIKVKERK